MWHISYLLTALSLLLCPAPRRIKHHQCLNPQVSLIKRGGLFRGKPKHYNNMSGTFRPTLRQPSPRTTVIDVSGRRAEVEKCSAEKSTTTSSDRERSSVQLDVKRMVGFGSGSLRYQS